MVIKDLDLSSFCETMNDGNFFILKYKGLLSLICKCYLNQFPEFFRESRKTFLQVILVEHYYKLIAIQRSSEVQGGIVSKKIICIICIICEDISI